MAITWQPVELPLTGQEQTADEAAPGQGPPRAARNVDLTQPGALRKRGAFEAATTNIDGLGSAIGRLTPGPNGGVRADLANGLTAYADATGQLLTSGSSGDGRLLASALPSPSAPVGRTLEAATPAYGWAHTLDLADFIVVLERSERGLVTDPPRITVLTKAGDLLLERLDAGASGLLAVGAGQNFTAVTNGATNTFLYASRNIATGQVSCVVLTVARAAGGVTVTAGATSAVAVANAFDVAAGPLGTYLLLLTEGVGTRLYLRSLSGSAVTNLVVGTLAAPTLCSVSTKIRGAAATGRACVVMGTGANIQARFIATTATSLSTTGALFALAVAHSRVTAAVAREAGAGINVAGYAILDTTPTFGGNVTPCVEWRALDVAGAAAGVATLPLAAQHGKPWSPADGRVVTPCWIAQTINPGNSGATAPKWQGTFSGTLAVGAGVAMIEPATGAGDGVGGYVSSNQCTLVGWAGLLRAYQPAVTGAVPLPNPTYATLLTEALVMCPTTLFDRRTTFTSTLRAVALRYPVPDAPDRPTAAPDVGPGVLLPDAVTRFSSGSVQVPAGYPHLAEILRIQQVVGAGLWSSASTLFRARYAWYDAANNELVSPWSLPTEIATPNTISDVQIDVRIPAHLQGVGARIEFSYARAGQVSYFQTRSTTVASGTTFSASQSADATPGQLFVSYFVAGQLETSVPVDTFTLTNVLPPSTVYACTYRNLTAVISAEGPALYVSKPAQEGVLPEWSAELAIPIPPWVGKPLACASVGDRLVVFGDQGIAGWTGDGLDALGGGAPLAGPLDIGKGISCRGVGGFLSEPGGVWFESRKTLCLLTVAGEIQSLGEAVQQDLLELPLPFAAAYWEALDARLWLRGDGLDEVNDILVRFGNGQWARWVLPPGTHVTALCAPQGAEGLLWVGHGSTASYYRTDLDGLDNSAIFPALDYTTPHTRIGATCAYQSVRGLTLAVEAKRSGVGVRVRAYKDGALSTVYDKTVLTDAVGVQELSYRLEPQQMPSRTVKWQITDVQAAGGSPGDGRAGIALLGATQEMGQRAGLRKTRPSRRG